MEKDAGVEDKWHIHDKRHIFDVISVSFLSFGCFKYKSTNFTNEMYKKEKKMIEY